MSRKIKGNAFNRKIFKVRTQILVSSKTKSYQIQRELSLLFIFYRQPSSLLFQNVVLPKFFIIFLLVLIIRIYNVQYIGRPLLLDFTKTPPGKSCTDHPTGSLLQTPLLDHLVVTHQTFFHQALLLSTLLVTTPLSLLLIKQYSGVIT